MKQHILLAAAAALTLTAAAQEPAAKTMRITHADGTSVTFQVSNIDKITFEDADAPVPGSFEAVDLGLSVMWASCNLGADSPEQYGEYYAYGETAPQPHDTGYFIDTYKWIWEDWNDWEYDIWERYLRLGESITGTNYDAAHVTLADKWRMPTKAEWEELMTCQLQWTSINGIAGTQITGPNGNSIFLPAAGWIIDGAQDYHVGNTGFYWTATENEAIDESRPYRVNNQSTGMTMGYDWPECGFSIRPVYGDIPEKPVQKLTPPDEAVDLGLSVKWSPRNLGATGDQGQGLYLCYGEMHQKLYSHRYNYKYYDPLTDSNISIGTEISGTEYDPVTAIWGDGWRLPTAAELRELLEKCEWTRAGTGYKVTGPNGNFILLPAWGEMDYRGIPVSYLSALNGYYGSGTLTTYTNPDTGEVREMDVQGLWFSGDTSSSSKPAIRDWLAREAGLQLRPVHE